MKYDDLRAEFINDFNGWGMLYYDSIVRNKLQKSILNELFLNYSFIPDFFKSLIEERKIVLDYLFVLRILDYDSDKYLDAFEYYLEMSDVNEQEQYVLLAKYFYSLFKESLYRNFDSMWFVFTEKKLYEKIDLLYGYDISKIIKSFYKFKTNIIIREKFEYCLNKLFSKHKLEIERQELENALFNSLKEKHLLI